MTTKFFYSPEYDFNLYGVEKLHKFDATKFSKAWALFQEATEGKVSAITPSGLANDQDLACVHNPAYLDSLKSASTIAKVIEVPFAKLLPNSLLNRRLLDPIRHATQGTLEATRSVLGGQCSLAMNFGGGYHHAFKTHGEGFCFFADAAYATVKARSEGLLQADDIVLMIDLDAHHGNGFYSYFKNDPSVQMFDIYNFQVYPGFHDDDGEESEYMLPIKSGTDGADYIDRLQKHLPRFLAEFKNPSLVFYNAGSDILKGDPLGLLGVSEDQVRQRDEYVLDSLKSIDAPTVILTSGGYTGTSHRLIAKLAELALGAS